MKKKQITWMFQYEVDDTKPNCDEADSLYLEIQHLIRKNFPKNSNQIVAYIHKESEKP